jgi:TonB family protein
VALAQPTVAASVPTVGAPLAQPTAEVAVPTAVAQVPPVRTQAPQAVAPGLPGGAVNVNDFVKAELVDTQPEVLADAKPVLPRTALMSRTPQDGPVILRATVNASGTVDEVAVLRPFPGSVAGVDDACVEALKKYRFKPATKNGVRVKTYASVTFRVTIKGR